MLQQMCLQGLSRARWRYLLQRQLQSPGRWRAEELGVAAIQAFASFHFLTSRSSLLYLLTLLCRHQCDPKNPPCEDSRVHKWCYDEDLCSKCKKKGLDDVKGKVACPVACAKCESKADSTSWYSKKVKYDCEWVAEKAKRCKSKFVDDWGVASREACVSACA